MKLDNSVIRRQDRLMSETRAHELLRTSEFGILSMVCGDDFHKEAYGIPVNFVWDGDDYIYVHCATVGKKLDAVASNPEVSFCVVGYVRLMPERFSTEFESLVIKGEAQVGVPEEEKRKALRMLIAKLCPKDKNTAGVTAYPGAEKFAAAGYTAGEQYIEKNSARTQIIRIKILAASGKSRIAAR